MRVKPISRKLFAIAPFAGLLAVFTTSFSLSAQQIPKLDDPANLAGERVSAPDLADTLPINHGAPALEQLLRKLRTRASFMLIVAHPDDEDGGMLTYLSRGQGARVAMLTLTRGEGGQNLMSGDFEDTLGLIRTQELLAAGRYMGVDQFFGTEVDFGFSKTKEEAFSKWTHDRVLYDAVRAVRLYRPLVIGSVFIGAATDGHGQHQVSGEIAQEVFKAAGDPKVFPDQIAQGLLPWQPLKVYARIPFARIDAQGMFDYATNQYAAPRFENYVTGKVADALPAANVMVAEGTTDALLGGLSYVQFARQGLALQKTQIGPGVRTAPAGRADARYHRYGSRVLVDGKPQPDDGDGTMESGFFEGIDTSLSGIASLAPEVAGKFRAPLEKIDAQIADAQAKFDASHTETIAPQLRTALIGVDEFIHELENSSVNDLPVEESYNMLHELRIKRVQLNNALVLALGLELKASSPTPLLTTVHTIDVVATLRNGGNTTVIKDTSPRFTALPAGMIFGGTIHWRGEALLLKPGESQDYKSPMGFISPIDETKPYFTRANVEQPYYDIADAALRNAPVTPAPLIANITVHTVASANDPGVNLQLSAAVSAANDAGLRPLLVVPPVSVALDRRATILTPRQNAVHADATIRADDSIQKLGGVKVLVGTDPKSRRELPGRFIPQEYQKVIGVDEHVGVSVDASEFGRGASMLTAVVSQNGHDYSEGYRAVGYGDLPRTNYYTPAALRVMPVDVTTAPGLNIAYLAGTGDDVTTALNDLGVTVHTIAVADVTPDKLKQYDAVVLGVRAYEAHRELLAANDTLNAYAAAGGVVIAQYNTRLPAGVGPYTLTLDHTENVVDETTPVAILDPQDPLLSWPNKITAADFNGWVEERGHGFMSSWDAHFKPLLESHDPGQPPQKGGLLVARTGKGAWIYLGLALYRQLPEGVPGAYRLLANLISAGKEPQTGVR